MLLPGIAALSSDRRQQKSKLGLIIPPEKERGQLGELTILCITVTVVWMGECFPVEDQNLGNILIYLFSG